ncbi:hypothetical protein M8C21_013459, partial [Ambrosia artemisiifolia]
LINTINTFCSRHQRSTSHSSAVLFLFDYSDHTVLLGCRHQPHTVTRQYRYRFVVLDYLQTTW